jgi:hypothetical protein
MSRASGAGLVALLTVLGATLAAPPQVAGAAEAAASAPVAAVATPARRLAVAVLADGKPLADADVLITAQGMNDKRLVTDQAGQVQWSPPVLQRLTLRVTAVGWKTHQQELPWPPQQDLLRVNVALERPAAPAPPQ